MTGYSRFSIEDQYRMITVERDQHIPRLAAAAAMWQDARNWLDYQCQVLLKEVNDLTETWPDSAGRLFKERVVKSLNSLWSWNDPALGITSTLPGRLNMSGSIPVSGVVDRINELIHDIQRAQPEVARLRDNYHGLPEHLKVLFERQTREEIGKVLDGLAPKYASVTAAMGKAVGKPWDGPREAVTESSPGKQAPMSAPGMNPAGAGGDHPAGVPADPASQPMSAQARQDPANALGALSQAAQSLGQSLGSGSSVSGPNPIGPVDLGSLPAAAHADYLGHSGDAAQSGSGLPSLAGSGLSGGAAGAGIPAVSPVANSASAAGMNAAAVAPAAAGTAAGTAGSGVGSGMMPPPMYPPHSAGNGAAGGIKPGAAEQAATGRPRRLKSGDMPGVSLRGRAGLAARGIQPVPVRRWADESDTVQLLDEELWQVDQEENKPIYRAGQ